MANLRVNTPDEYTVLQSALDLYAQYLSLPMEARPPELRALDLGGDKTLAYALLAEGMRERARKSWLKQAGL